MSFIWGKPDDRTSMKYSTDQSAGFVEPTPFVSSNWQYDEEGKEAAADSRASFSEHVAPGGHASDDGGFLDDQYGELEITIKFTSRTGSSVQSRKLKLMSRSGQLIGSQSAGLKSELSLESLPSSQAPHRLFSPQDNQSLCVADEQSGCACKKFSPSIFRHLLAQTLSGSGLSFDPSFDRVYSCAVSDYPEESAQPKSRQASASYGKKRLLSNASEDSSQIQPSKKNPRLAAVDSADGQDLADADADDGTERHTCPYFKMYPEKYLECGTKDLAQRPKIKSHIIKDHLKKGGMAIPPEIKSQKCEPWDRWCKWIVQNSSKSDRPVPNSTPDFYPVLNYVVTAASEIPSDGLTCFSSVILRLFKSVQSNPSDWSSFINGLEELERSLNTAGPATVAPSVSSRRNFPPKEDEKPLTLNEDTHEEASQQAENVVSTRCEEPLEHFSTSATVTNPEQMQPVATTAYDMPQHPPTTYTSVSDPSLTTAPEEFAYPHSHMPHNMYTNSNEYEVDLASWIDYNPTMAPEQHIQPVDTSFFEPIQQSREQQPHPEPPTDHFSVPPGIGTNSKSLVRAAQPPRVRKRKHGTVRSHHVEGATLNDNAPPSQTQHISVATPHSEEKYEFTGRFSLTNFLRFLERKFNFTFDREDERKLWCVDVREDIHIHSPDGIKAHLKSWSTKGSFTTTPVFRIDTGSSRTLGFEKYAMFTPDFVEGILDGDSIADMSYLLSFRPGSHITYPR
ncbi:hypothetical protein H072_5812 [Dactylellina haptotyla CBS 200.50]|uniref:Uncharacterized protein n=1 Tax=Dactylellina haptotyla (strain CBS 200.50) TaxID=1284197 RepID=S8AGX9_DACHA|nr:hypothetical protein H072_5812 [Dactylellina haptotyla CBS 200.50]